MWELGCRWWIIWENVYCSSRNLNCTKGNDTENYSRERGITCLSEYVPSSFSKCSGTTRLQTLFSLWKKKKEFCSGAFFSQLPISISLAFSVYNLFSHSNFVRLSWRPEMKFKGGNQSPKLNKRQLPCISFFSKWRLARLSFGCSHLEHPVSAATERREEAAPFQINSGFFDKFYMPLLLYCSHYLKIHNRNRTKQEF